MSKTLKRNSDNVCIPYYLVGALIQCPEGSAMCDDHTTAATAHSSLTGRCVCGGGKPCQYNHGPGCFAKGEADDATLRCPDQTTECSCTCGTADASKPCQATELGSNFCWPTSGVPAVCPIQTTHCQIAAAPTHVSKLLPPTPAQTPSPTPNPNTALGSCTSVTEWGAWTACSRECGTDAGGAYGKRSRSTKVTIPASCSAPDQTQDCNAHACTPVDCDFEWPVDWGHCSYSCGSGFRYKKPVVKTPAIDGGAACPIPLRQPCNLNSCAVQKKSCPCDPLKQMLVDPDAPPPSKHHVQCVR